jgi:glycosyltransferase involved in cell wall biosynthesis
MKERNQVSVILACYNGGVKLKNCLNSINSQDVCLELIFINDGSTDKTLELINNFEFCDNVVLKIISRENKGFLYSLYEGVNIASHDIIARIDADDIWCNNHLVLLLNEFKKDDDLVLAGSCATLIDDDDNVIDVLDMPRNNEEIVKFLHRDNPFIHSSVLFKKNCYYQTSGYLLGEGTSSMHIADYNLWFELSKLGKCINLEEKTILYRVSNKSMSRSLNKVINYKARYEVMKKVNQHYKRYQFYSFMQQVKVIVKIFKSILKTKLVK